MSFGDNDYTIRVLMRFTEMTNRELRFDDVIRNGGALITNVDEFKLKGGLNSFIF